MKFGIIEYSQNMSNFWNSPRFDGGFTIELFSLFIFTGVVVRADIFTSTVAMEKLLNGEIKVVATVDAYIAAEYKRLADIKSMAVRYEHATREWTKQIDSRFLANPVATFKIIKQLAQGWILIEETMRMTSANEVFEDAVDPESEIHFTAPNRSDVEGAAVGLMRIQDTYQLDPSILANGYLPGTPQFSPLSAKDCFDIGMVAFDQYDDYHAVSWFREALNRNLAEQPNPTIDEVEILDNMVSALAQQEQYVHAYLLTERILQLHPDDPAHVENLEYYEKEMKIRGQQSDVAVEEVVGRVVLPKIRIERNLTVVGDELAEPLCRGQLKPQDDVLTCYYKNDIPFLRLAPIKVEEISKKPKVLIFRAVVTDWEAAKIKELATPTLHRSEVVSEGGTEYASYRISTSTWLKDSAHRAVAALTVRVGHMTGLDMVHAEQLQIANYGLGGHYETHHDCGLFYGNKEDEDKQFRERYSNLDTQKSPDIDDRVATVMFYISQPIAGGATVFPELGIGAFPTFGDALFWYNVFRNGSADGKLVHAACPVLAGSKWVMNKWISTMNQEFIYSCALDQNK